MKNTSIQSNSDKQLKFTQSKEISLDEISQITGLSRMRICQIEKKFINLIRKALSESSD